MVLVTCIGATSGIMRIRIVPSLVAMRTKYFFAGSNATTVGSFRLVFQPATVLLTLAAATCASMPAIALSPAGAAAFFASAAAAGFLTAAARAMVTPETSRVSEAAATRAVRFIEDLPPVMDS